MVAPNWSAILGSATVRPASSLVTPSSPGARAANTSQWPAVPFPVGAVESCEGGEVVRSAYLTRTRPMVSSRSSMVRVSVSAPSGGTPETSLSESVSRLM